MADRGIAAHENLPIKIQEEANKAFDTLAETYDDINNDKVALAENAAITYLLEDGGFLQGEILDIGCGTGFLLDQCTVNGNYFGIDPSGGMLKVAREKHPDHCFMKATIEEFVAEPDYGFDSAISVFCALNYCDNLRGSLESIHECLNPDGRVFLVFHGARRILEPSYCETMSAVGFDPTDTVFYSPEEIRGYMEEAQFNNIGVFGFNRGDQPDWAPQWWLERDIIDGVTVTRIPPADSRYVITTGLV